MALAVRLPEDLDAATMTALKPRFEELSASREDVVLDLRDVQFIDSSGVGGIVFLYKRLVAAGYSLTVTGARDQPLHLLTHLRLVELLIKK